MSDPNPYESPKASEPLKRAQVAKRGIGVGLILLLTPPTMFIAVWGSCAARQIMPGSSSELVVVFGVPLAILTGLMIWASVLDRRHRCDSNRETSRVGIFLATPVAVTVATVAGIGLAALIFLTSSNPGQEEASMRVAMLVFWLVTGATLLAMLLIAWRVGR